MPMQSDKWRKMQNQFWLLWFLLDVHGRGIVAILIVLPLVWARVVAPRPISRWAHLKERLHRSRMCDPTKIGLTTPLNCYFLRSRLQHVSRVVCTWRLGDLRPALVSLVLLPLRLRQSGRRRRGWGTGIEVGVWNKTKANKECTISTRLLQEMHIF